MNESFVSFSVAGIGASAGGLNAFKKLIAAIPHHSGMAWIIIQHVQEGDNETGLSELIAETSALPVLTITDDCQLAPDHIYILPTGKLLTANDDVLTLSAPLKNENIAIVTNSIKQLVTMEAIPLPNATEPYLRVLFQNKVQVSEPGNIQLQVAGYLPHQKKEIQELRIEQLEKELAMVREDMRSITEEQEAANEELQCANEELLSSSEELQRLNQKLATSQAELRRTNEELSMLNHELRYRNEQLNNARHFAETIINTVLDPLVILGSDLRIRSATRGFYHKFQLKQDDIEGAFFTNIKSCPWNSPLLIEKLEKVIPDGISFTNLEVTCHLPHCGECILLMNGRQMERINGEQLILVSIEDITLSRREKDELLAAKHELEERVQLAVEATGIATWEYDPVSGKALVDEHFKRLFGYTAQEEVSYHSLRERIHPDDVAVRDMTMMKTLQGADDGTYEIVYRIITKDTNELRWIKSKGKVFSNEDAKAVRLVGILLDITKEKITEGLIKESEERFRLASDAAAALIWMSGADRLCNYFNKSWLNFRGRSLEEEYGNGWEQGIHPDDYDQCLKTYNDSFGAQQACYMEYRMLRHDGGYRWISNSGTPRFSSAGIFEGFIGTCMDIHEARMAKEELEKLVEERSKSLRAAVSELEASNQNLEEFAYVASHDLQEPLRKIKTFVDRLEVKASSQLDEDNRVYLTKITKAANRMSLLIEDILSFSKLNNTADGMQAVDLNLVIKNILNDFDVAIQQKNAVIELGKLPVINGVPMRMNQLFQNLMSNALKFSCKTGTPVIHIDAAILTEEEKKLYPLLKQESNYSKIIFRDNGIGFNQQFAEKVFVIFQRLNGRSEYEGTGIGLAICRKIVVNHQGLIFANSKENEGTEFSILLPVS